MKIFIVLHDYTDGMQVEAFTTMEKAKECERLIIDDYSRNDGINYTDHVDLNEHCNEVDIIIEEVELQ